MGHEILFVETGNFLGRHLWQLVRGPGRRSVARQLLGGELVVEGIRVRKGLNLMPWGHTYAAANAFNCLLTRFAVRRWARRRPVSVLWLYDPCAAPLVGRCRESLAVYDCVDDYAEQVGGHPRKRALVTRSDREAGARVQIVFATAQALYDRHKEVNPRTHLVPNVGDYGHFAPASVRSFAAPELGDLTRPVIGFAGNLMAQKVDLDLLYSIASARPSWTLALIGPAREDAQPALERLEQLPNVRWLGPKPYSELPRYVAAFDVAVIPYVSSTYSRSCFPLKTYEYLAAGKPVVAAGLPELAPWRPTSPLPKAPTGSSRRSKRRWRTGATSPLGRGWRSRRRTRGRAGPSACWV